MGPGGGGPPHPQRLASRLAEVGEDQTARRRWVPLASGSMCALYEPVQLGQLLKY